MTYDDAGSGTVLELPSERLHDYEQLILQYITLFGPSSSLRRTVSRRQSNPMDAVTLCGNIPTAHESVDPNSTELQPFMHQVGGHKGMQVSGEGSLVIKSTVPVELQFYQNIMASPALASLRRWVPTYLGTLHLEGQNTAQGISRLDAVPENEKDECLYRYFTLLKT